MPFSNSEPLSFVAEELREHGKRKYFIKVYSGLSQGNKSWSKTPFYGTAEEVQEALRRSWILFKAGATEFDYHEGPLSLTGIQGKFDFGDELEALVRNLEDDIGD